ncbi:hypothetical protein J9303_12670 [Bacillaceae bacterium Marseille-Q3522]|nr:hypothetical protein [Bacillaceae bacterium Marseille-Q3522]
MSGTAKGTMLLVYKDMKYQFVIFSLITLVMALIYFAIGFIISPNESISGPSGFTIFGPFYGLMAVYPAITYTVSFRYAMGFGSTRTLFFKVFFALGILFVTASMIVVNILYFIMEKLYELHVNHANMFHIGSLTNFHKSFFPYLWIDIMIGIGILGVTFLITSLWYKYGFLKISFGFIFLGFLAFLLFYKIGFLEVFQWIAGLNQLLLFSGIGIIGLVALFSAYFFIRNAPLSYMAKKG